MQDNGDNLADYCINKLGEVREAVYTPLSKYQTLKDLISIHETLFDSSYVGRELLVLHQSVSQHNGDVVKTIDECILLLEEQETFFHDAKLALDDGKIPSGDITLYIEQVGLKLLGVYAKVHGRSIVIPKQKALKQLEIKFSEYRNNKN